MDWVCAFLQPGNFKRTDGKHKAWAHPNQGVDEGILKPTSLISNAARGRAFVRCKRKDHKEEQTLITPPTKHLGEMANSTLALLVNIWKPLTSKPLPTHAHKATYSSTQRDPHTACVSVHTRENMCPIKKRCCLPTRERLLRLAAQLSDTISIAVTSVVDSLNEFVPRLSNLIEHSSLWLLALIWKWKSE